MAAGFEFAWKLAAVVGGVAAVAEDVDDTSAAEFVPVAFVADVVEQSAKTWKWLDI